MAEKGIYVLAMLGAVSMSAASQMLLKKAARTEWPSALREYLNVWVIGGYGLLVLSMLSVIFACRGLEVKNIPVLESLGFPLVMLLGRVFYGEKLTRGKLIGMGLILLGILVFYL